MTGVELPSSRLTRFRGARSRSFQPTPLGAGERDQADPLVLHEDVADLRRGADEDVEPARREPGVRLELGEQERRERRLRGRLEDDGTAGCESRRDLVGNEVERKVERRDRAHHADGDADRHRELALARLRGVHRNDLARQLAGLDGRHRVRGHRACHLDPGRLHRLSGLGADQPRGLVGAPTEATGNPDEDLGALVCRERLTHRPFGGVYRAARLGGACLRHPPHHGAVVRRAHLEPLTGLDPLAVE